MRKDTALHIALIQTRINACYPATSTKPFVVSKNDIVSDTKKAEQKPSTKASLDA